MFKWFKLFKNKKCCKNCISLHYLNGYYCGNYRVAKNIENLNKTLCNKKYFKKRYGKFWLYEGAEF